MNGIKKKILYICVALLSCAFVCMAGCSMPEQQIATFFVQTEQTPEAGHAAQPSPSPAQTVQTPESAAPDLESPLPLPEPYQAVVAQYADAMNHGYYASLGVEERDKAFGEDVASEWRIIQKPAYYALYDFDDNGTDELLIGTLMDGIPTFYDIRSIAGGEAVQLFDASFGYRTNFDVYADGTIKVTWSSSAFESGFDYYKVSGAEAVLLSSQKTMADIENADALQYFKDGAEISEEEYFALDSSYDALGPQPLNWVCVTE